MLYTVLYPVVLYIFRLSGCLFVDHNTTQNSLNITAEYVPEQSAFLKRKTFDILHK